VDAASNLDGSVARANRTCLLVDALVVARFVCLARFLRAWIVSGFEAKSGSAAGNLAPMAMRIVKTDVDVHIWLLWQATLSQAEFDPTMGKLNH